MISSSSNFPELDAVAVELEEGASSISNQMQDKRSAGEYKTSNANM